MNTPKPKILYVDDEISNLTAFQAAFEDDYEVVGLSSPSHAMEVIHYFSDFPVIISDQKMPEMNGIAFLAETARVCPDSSRILVSAYPEKEYLLEAINTGKVNNYIVKPWDEDEVRNLLREAETKYSLIQENKKLFSELSDKIQELTSAHNTILHQEKMTLAGNLMAGLSHEIRNLLMPISLLEITDLSNGDEMRRNIQMVTESRNRIITLVDEIRGLVRNEVTEYVYSEVSVPKLISECTDLIKMYKPAKNTVFTADLQYSGIITVSKTKMIQVLINLMKNSIEAMADCEKKILHIEVKKTENSAVFSVCDTGVGLTESQIKKLWEPFYTTKGDMGTGVGLGICRKIIEKHGGTIECFSEPGVRTEFRFTIPQPDDSI